MSEIYAAALVVEELAKRYGDRKVLEIDRLELSWQGTMLICGPNGSGKSTLLRILAGISTADSGKITRHPELASGRLGYLPQRGGLYEELTVAENLRLRRRLFGLRGLALEDLWYVGEFGLRPFLGRRVSQLSGGYQRLAAVAATLHIEPTWLLLDEPFGGADTQHRRILARRLNEVANGLDLFVIGVPDPQAEIAVDDTLYLLNGRIGK